MTKINAYEKAADITGLLVGIFTRGVLLGAGAAVGMLFVLQFASITIHFG